MTQQTKDELQNIVTSVFYYLKSNNSTGKGIVDMAVLSSQVINFEIYKNEIKSYERIECCEHVCKLLNMMFNNALSNSDLLFVKNSMLNQAGYDYSIVHKILTGI